MATYKKYWKNEAELSSDNEVITKLQNEEFIDPLPENHFLEEKEILESSETTRRDFLKYVGFSTAAASLAACEGPVIKSIPYVVQPEKIIPGVANFYATTIADGFDFASVLIKTREGRPIKVENNVDALVRGGANARVQASVLSMYDSLRFQGPVQNGKNVSWSQLDESVLEQLTALKEANSPVVLLTQTFASPTTAKIIADFQEKFPNVRHITYDAISESAALDAFSMAYGSRALPSYDFSKAEVIVSFGADFLGDWQGGGFSSAYTQNRVPNKDNGKATMSKHFQFEANMSLSGANADKRIPLTPSQQKLALAKLYGYITGTSVVANLPQAAEVQLKKAADQIKRAGKKGLLVTGLNDVNAQLTALAINDYLQSEAVDTQVHNLVRQGNDSEVTQLIQDLNSGAVKGILMAGVNPAYTLSESKAFLEGLQKASLSVSFSMKNDETAQASQWVATTPHYLESWGDTEFSSGNYGLTQPTIRPLFDTRQFQDSLLKWTGSQNSYYQSITSYWKNSILNGNSWSKVLHDGFLNTNKKESTTSFNATVSSAVTQLTQSKSKGLELVLYSKTGLGDGQQANNPWLQELPDPITRVSWDNYLTVSKSDAASLGLTNENVANGALNGSFAKVSVNGTSLVVPVLIQPGQAKGSVGLAFGYGKTTGIKEEMKVGVNAYALYSNFNQAQEVSVEAVEGTHEFACVQLHNTLMGRGDIVKETSLEIFNTKDVEYWNPIPKVSLNHIETPIDSPDVDLYDEFDRSIGHHFNLSIDLNACTGCGACVIACHAENNVPVVGKQEIRKSRDMHWLRIDRYYSAEDSFEEDLEVIDGIDGLGASLSTFGEMEDPSENPQVTFQPVMCQHCNHAPCETVCPVAATSHGRQGQNQMAYNRCVGTRYCANNCPYKVRRFNWFLYNENDEFDYHMNNDLGRMVLNPDVVVRSRGVMEKCSMCIQKTQKTILDAKLEGRTIKDGEFQTACSSACSNGAMTFGDINDKDSKVSKLKESDRKYHLLESVGTKPNVMYQVKVRNAES